jgi:hypothetical protein
MNLFPPELAPLMLASPEGAQVVTAGALLAACVAGVLARRLKLTLKPYRVVCSGVALWVVARDFGIPLDALLCAAAPQFALPYTTADAWVGIFGLAQYVVFSEPAPVSAETVHVAWVAILAFFYVLGAANVTFGVARLCVVCIWYVYPRISHMSSGAMIMGCAVSGMPGVLASLGSTLCVAVLGSFAPMVVAIVGVTCMCFDYINGGR